MAYSISFMLCVVFLVLVGSVFATAVYIFSQNSFGFKSFALFYPAMGGLLITGYYLVKDYFPHLNKVDKKVERIEFAMLIKGKVIPLSLRNRTSFDDIGEDLAGYRINDFSQGVLKDFFTRKTQKEGVVDVIGFPLEETYLDVVDYSVLEYLSNHLNEEYSSFSSKGIIEGKEIINKNRENFLIGISGEELERIRKINGHSTRNPKIPYSESIKDWALPPKTAYSKIRKDGFRSHVFKNPKWELKINIFRKGNGHFDPMNFRFHRFLRGLHNDAEGDNTELKKYTIFFIFEQKEQFKFSDSFESEVEWVNAFLDTFKKDFSWDYLKKRIKDEYLTQSI